MILADEYNLSPSKIKVVTDTLNELKIQAMMFDMDIDIEIWGLVPKRKDLTPIWIKRWREKFEESDYTVYDNGN